MIGRLLAIALIAMSFLVCVPETDAHGGGFSVRGRVFVPRSRVIVQPRAQVIVRGNVGGYGGGGAFIPRSNVVFVPSRSYGYGGAVQVIRAPDQCIPATQYIQQAPVQYVAPSSTIYSGYQSQVLFAPTTGGGCYGGF